MSAKHFHWHSLDPCTCAGRFPDNPGRNPEAPEMTRSQFETAAREQNERHAAARAEARKAETPCSVVTMFAFGGVDYCSAHGVMGPCPFGAALAKAEGGAK